MNHNPLTVACPYCDAAPQRRCSAVNGSVVTDTPCVPHKIRQANADYFAITGLVHSGGVCSGGSWIPLKEAVEPERYYLAAPLEGEKLKDATSYTVACKDTGTDGIARYFLATRQVWMKREEAEAYAATCSPSRDAIVIEGRFFNLRSAK